MKKINKKFLYFIFSIGIAVGIISVFFYQICIVHGDSMYPTLKNGNIALIKKYNLQFKDNDIVVIKKNDKIIIKRIIGMPNDEVKIDQDLYINGRKISDLPTQNEELMQGIFLLQEHEYFVIGDNIKNSIDSRFYEIGIINKDEIIGKVLFKLGG